MREQGNVTYFEIMVVAQLRKYGELRNDLSSFEGRTRTDNTLVKTRHSGDCAATQTGEFRG